MNAADPSYQIFHLDGSGWVKNVLTYWVDLEKYNAMADKGDYWLEFDLRVDYQKDYEIDKFDKQNLQSIITKFVNNADIIKKFIHNKKGKEIK